MHAQAILHFQQNPKSSILQIQIPHGDKLARLRTPGLGLVGGQMSWIQISSPRPMC